MTDIRIKIGGDERRRADQPIVDTSNNLVLCDPGATCSKSGRSLSGCDLFLVCVLPEGTEPSDD